MEGGEDGEVEEGKGETPKDSGASNGGVTPRRRGASEDPEARASKRLKPSMTATGRSSRAASRAASVAGSRAGSKAGSRAGSPVGESRLKTVEESDATMTDAPVETPRPADVGEESAEEGEARDEDVPEVKVHEPVAKEGEKAEDKMDTT